MRELEIWHQMQEHQQMLDWSSFPGTRAGNRCQSQLIPKNDDTWIKNNRSRNSKWSMVELAGDVPADGTTKQNHKINTHTHTHTPTLRRPPPRSERPWYLRDALLSFLFLGHTNQTKQKSQEHNVHLVSLVDFLLSRLRVSQWLERMGILPLFIASLCCCDPSWTNGCPC